MDKLGTLFIHCTCHDPHVSTHARNNKWYLVMFMNKFLMMARERSTEEEDTLERSTKKFKDVYSVGGTYGRGLGKEAKEWGFSESYRDRLVGSIPSAYEQAFGFESTMEEGLCERMTMLLLSKEEKRRIREPWGQAIIVKSRNVGFLYLSSRLRSMWKPVGWMDIIDL